MKRCFVLLIVFAFLNMASGVFSQDVVNEEKAALKNEEYAAKKNGTKTFEMGEIVVKDRAIASIEDASTTTEITDKDIKARGEKNLGDSLQMVPGVSVYSHGKGITRFKMRGFDQDRCAILIDGIPVLDYDSSFDISQVPVMNVSKIVVNRGVSSVLYGANGALGSMNIISKKPEKMFTSVNAEYGEHNNYTLNAANGSPIGDAYYWITGSVVNSEGYEVSGKLDKTERRKWFDKLVRYDLYGRTYDQVALTSKDAYINDTGVWNHTEYTKYQVGGKLGYNFTGKIEAGLSADYHKTEQKSNTFSSNLFSSYNDQTDTWSNPPNNAYDMTGKAKGDAFQNRAFYWPERYDFTVSPYFRGEFGDITVKANLFYYKQYTDLEGYATQDHSVAMFPASVTGFPADLNHSMWTEESYGANLFPSWKIADWNKLNFSLMYRTEEHTSEEKAISAAESPNIWAAHGGDAYKTKFLSADYYTIAVEDELNFSKKVEVSVGISYDAQNFTENKQLNSSFVYEDSYIAKDDSAIWGTRDSFNPAVSVVWNTIEDLLKLRAAASSKTKFPSMSAYSSIYGTTVKPDLKIDPERSYNANAGFEVTPMGKLPGIRTDYFYSRFNDKIESIWDQNAGTKAYTNIDGMVSQGIEITLSSMIEKIAGIVDISSSLSYTYTRAEQMSNDHDSNVNKGDKVENTPEHMFTADFRFDFISGTSLNIFGQHTRNQVMYAMKSVPATTAGTPYSTDYFEAVELHNPLMLNVKVSQKLFGNFDVYAMCKNVLDDYNADPFNPGPGRMFYMGGSAEF
ncbi:MAG TPA: TonB-dependent receptor [Spirochaetota bacterium]|nr:TonB-dependent receptor [Spirochaetota bacterium]